MPAVARSAARIGFALLAVAALMTEVAAQPACYTPQQAAAHVGTHGCVTGRVSNVYWAQQSNGQPTFLDFGRSFVVVIWGEDRDRFTPPPELWRGADLTVWGTIQSYQGRPQIILRDPAQFAPPPARTPVVPAPPVAPVRPAAPPVQPAAPPAPVEQRPAATPAPPSTPAPAPPEPEPTPAPTLPEPEPTPEPTPFPASVATPATPLQARALPTPLPAALERDLQPAPPRTPPPDAGRGPPPLLVAGAAALVVLGLLGAALARRERRG
jgi:hypothetical protein